MTFIDTLVIFWTMVLITTSALLCYVIHKHISNKAPVELTVIDLLYQDIIIYIFLFMVSFSGALIHCLSSKDLELDFWPALVYAILLFFWMGCLSRGQCYKTFYICNLSVFVKS